jgi:hypothetical protein
MSVIDDLQNILDDYIGESTTDPKTEESISLDVLSYLAGAFPGKEISVDITFSDHRKGAVTVTASAGKESWTIGVHADVVGAHVSILERDK